ncbi:MAG: Gfo/Idh/MocA family oxidoreductase [Opitutales bacterium]|nr:Gfo/Idh/MocA family oxidoreductase [Opitutales bacterium]
MMHRARISKPIRAAIIGYGGSGKLAHAYGLQANKQFEIAAVCDLSPDKRKEAETDLGCRTYDDLAGMLQKEPLDLVSIITRTDTHCALTCQCLEAGVNVLITKPWAMDRSEAEQILSSWKRSGCELFAWLPSYWFPEYLKIRDLIREGAIGDVFLIRRYVSQFWRRSDWQTELRYGGGYLLNWGMHIVQPVMALAGSPVKRVFGQLQQVLNPGDAEDNFLAVLEFENGVRGITEFTQATEGLPSFMIQGTAGTILSDGKQIRVFRKNPSETVESEVSEYAVEGKIYGDEADIYRDVAATLLEGKAFPVTPTDAYEGTCIIDAIRASHDSRQVITLGRL